jgi:predicted outer membrane repeat protein
VASQLASVRSDLTALQNSVDLAAIRKECVLMLGDSYAQGVHAESATEHGGNWQDYLTDTFGFTDTYKYKAGSAGFVATSTSTSGSASTVPTGTTYNEVLNYAYDYINGLGRAREVKHIIIQGGVNDGSRLINGGTTESAIMTAISTCLANLRTKFPNAKVYVVYCACGYTSWMKSAVRAVTIPTLYNTAACNGGAVYGQCTNLPWIHGNDAASHDGSHPSSAMQRLIAGYIARLLCGDDKDYSAAFSVNDSAFGASFVANVTSDHRLIFPINHSIAVSHDGGAVPFNDGTIVQPTIVGAHDRLETPGADMTIPCVYFNGNSSYIGQFTFRSDGRIAWRQRDLSQPNAASVGGMTSLSCLIDRRIG